VLVARGRGTIPGRAGGRINLSKNRRGGPGPPSRFYQKGNELEKKKTGRNAPTLGGGGFRGGRSTGTSPNPNFSIKDLEKRKKKVYTIRGVSEGEPGNIREKKDPG